jgi:hypothetical protein
MDGWKKNQEAVMLNPDAVLLIRCLIAFALLSHVGGEIIDLPHIGNVLAMVLLQVYLLLLVMEKKT